MHGAAIDAALCSVIDVGQLRAEGRGVKNGLVRHMPWVGLGLGLTFDLHLSKRWSLTASGASQRRLRADRFVFNADTTIYQLSGIDGYLSAGLAFRCY